jgi:hypothetical protein
MHRTRDVLDLTTHSSERGRQHFLTGRERTPTRCTSTTDGACSVGEKGIQRRDQPNSGELELILPPGRSPWPSQIPVSECIVSSRHEHLVQGWASGNPKRGRKRQQTGFEVAQQTSREGMITSKLNSQFWLKPNFYQMLCAGVESDAEDSTDGNVMLQHATAKSSPLFGSTSHLGLSAKTLPRQSLTLLG